MCSGFRVEGSEERGKGLSTSLRTSPRGARSEALAARRLRRARPPKAHPGATYTQPHSDTALQLARPDTTRAFRWRDLRTHILVRCSRVPQRRSSGRRGSARGAPQGQREQPVSWRRRRRRDAPRPSGRHTCPLRLAQKSSWLSLQRHCACHRRTGVSTRAAFFDPSRTPAGPNTTSKLVFRSVSQMGDGLEHLGAWG